MSTNTPASRMDTGIPPDDLQQANDAIQVLMQKLMPHLVSLGTEDRRATPRMGDKAAAFVDKAMTYARSHPEYKPAYVDIDEFQRSVDTMDALRPIEQTLSQLKDMIEDSLAVAGSEAYTASLAFYQSLKTAAKLNQPGAVTMYDDLATRFQGVGRSPKAPPSPAGSNTPAGT